MEYPPIKDIRDYPQVLKEGERVIVTEQSDVSAIGIVEEGVVNTSDYNIDAFLKVIGNIYRQVVLYGSVIRRRYTICDLSIDGRFLDFEAFADICRKQRIATIPILAKGRYTLEMINVKKNIIIRPVHERTHPTYGRVIFQYRTD